MSGLFVLRQVSFRTGRIGSRLHKLLCAANGVSTRVEVLLVDESDARRTHSLSLTPEQARSLAGQLLRFANGLEGEAGSNVIRLTGDADMLNITKDQIIHVLTEYDAMGEEAFLAKYGFRPGRYMLVRGSKRYHSKAVFGAAMGKGPSEFSGGAATVQKTAEKLGLKVEVRS